MEACGAWEGSPCLIHEHEAVYDAASAANDGKRCRATQRGRIG